MNLENGFPGDKQSLEILGLFVLDVHFKDGNVMSKNEEGFSNFEIRHYFFLTHRTCIIW